jgi:hypothetical protein
MISHGPPKRQMIFFHRNFTAFAEVIAVMGSASSHLVK